MSATSDPTSDEAFSVALDAEGLKRRSINGSAITLAAQGAKMAIQFGAQLIIARLLFPADFGLLAMTYPIISFVQIFNDIGLGQAIVQRERLTQTQVSALFWINILMSCGLACGVAAIAPLAALIYHEPRILRPMLVLGALIPVSALGINPTSLLSRRMRYGALAGIDLLGTLTGVVVTILCAWIGLHYWSLVVGQLASTGLTVALAWPACGWRPSRPSFPGSIWADLKFGGNVTGANLATFITTSGDNMIVGLTTGRVSLGLYDRSYRLVVQPLGQVLAPISQVAVPLLSRLVNQPDTYRSIYIKIIQTIFIISLPIMITCIIEGDAIIDLFLGNRWTKAGPIFSWICVGGLTSGLYSSAYWVFISQARTRELRRITTAVAAINIASFLLGAIWGVVGVAAMGSIVFVTVTTPLMLFGATRSGPVRFHDVIQHATPFVFQSAVIYACLLVLKHHLNLGEVGNVVLISALSIVGFSILAVFSASERQLFRDLSSLLATTLKARRFTPPK